MVHVHVVVNFVRYIKEELQKKKEIAISIGIKRACKSTKIIDLHECQACTNLCIRYVHHRKKK